MSDESSSGMIPLFYALSVLVVLAAAFTWQEHRYAQQDAILMGKRFAKITRLEDATRDMLRLSNRSIILYYCGERKPWDGYVIFWPESAERLLGWTWSDIQKRGLGCMMMPEDREPHVNALEKFVDIPLINRKTSIVKKRAVHKDGHLVPVTMSVWVVGDTTRTVAATMDASANIVEK